MTHSTTSRNQIGNKILRAVISLAFWLGVWQLCAVLVGKELLLPEPAAVWRALSRLAAAPGFWKTALDSLARILGGWLAGAILGTVIAVLTGALQWADLLLSPAIRVMRAVPVASFILLVLLWAPTGRVPAIISALMVLPVIWGNVRKGIRQTDPLLLEAARHYRFGAIKTGLLIYVPSVLPYFASASTTALGLAWKAGVAAEVLCLPRRAIGTEIYHSKIYLETADLFAWTLVVIILSLVLETALRAVFRRLERRLTL